MARRIVRAWRSLTGGSERRDAERATLVACSGGVDSCALAIALSGVRPAPVVGHVVHDLREASETAADRDAARALAERLGLAFAEAEVFVRDGPGNAEARARRARYDALARMATAHGCGFIATGHHADDQLETVLMRLIRGSGPRGLGGIRPVRSLGAVSVVRPMLEVTRADAVRLCEGVGWAWREDATNRDESMVRNAIRARVIPEIRAVRPDAAQRAAVTATVCRLAADALEREARLVLNAVTRRAGEGPLVLARAGLAAAPMAVRCEALRMVLADAGDAGGTGKDRAGWRVLEPAARAIGDRGTEPRAFRVGSMVVSVRAHEVCVEAVGSADA